MKVLQQHTNNISRRATVRDLRWRVGMMKMGKREKMTKKMKKRMICRQGVLSTYKWQLILDSWIYIWANFYQDFIVVLHWTHKNISEQIFFRILKCYIGLMDICLSHFCVRILKCYIGPMNTCLSHFLYKDLFQEISDCQNGNDSM